MSTRYKTDVKSANNLQEPKMYAVIMHNDDFTSMDFVVDVLVRIFHKTIQQATETMMKVHESGSAVVGIYTYDVAITKKNQTDLMAKEKDFPLKISVCEAVE